MLTTAKLIRNKRAETQVAPSHPMDQTRREELIHTVRSNGARYYPDQPCNSTHSVERTLTRATAARKKAGRLMAN